MQTSVLAVGAANAMVLAMAVGVMAGEQLTGQVAASAATTAAGTPGRQLERASHDDGGQAAVATIARHDLDELRADPPSGQAEPVTADGDGAGDEARTRPRDERRRQPGDERQRQPGDDGRSQPNGRGQHPRTEPVHPPEMGRVARVVAACESGERHASGTPVIGSHRWHVNNDHGGTDSGAFQFLDSTWRWVATEIGASQYGRARNAPPRVQLEAFRWLWRRDPGAWNASRSCWAPLLGR